MSMLPAVAVAICAGRSSRRRLQRRERARVATDRATPATHPVLHSRRDRPRRCSAARRSDDPNGPRPSRSSASPVTGTSRSRPSPRFDLAVQTINFPVGAQSGWHSHPGPVFIIVESGDDEVLRVGRSDVHADREDRGTGVPRHGRARAHRAERERGAGAERRDVFRAAGRGAADRPAESGELSVLTPSPVDPSPLYENRHWTSGGGSGLRTTDRHSHLRCGHHFTQPHADDRVGLFFAWPDKSPGLSLIPHNPEGLLKPG